MRKENLKKNTHYRCKNPRKILAKWIQQFIKKDDISGEGCF